MSSVGLDRVGGRLPTLPALDGIRAIAIAGVLLYHSDIFWFPGGLLGVEVFFVLSGYLITSILWTELLAEGRVGLKNFWKRRARRLFPALFVMLAVASTVFVIWYPQEVARVRGDVAAAASYTSNWYQIHGGHSYFDSFARPSPFGHLWSLAIEEQFYLFWPPILIGLWTWLRRPSRVAGTILAGAVVSVVALSLLYHAGNDPSRVYYGTDTRASALLIGSALAIMWRPWAFTSWERRHADSPWLLDFLTVASGAVLVWAFMRFDDFSPTTYRPGLLLVSLATASLIASAVHPNARVGRFLGTKPLRWLGQRSYSIYIWYFPVFALTRPGVDFDLSIEVALAIRMAITLTIAELSYRFVEQPIRHGALGRWVERTRERIHAPRPFGRRNAYRLGAAFVVILLAVSTLAVALAAAPSPRAEIAGASSPAGNFGRPEDIGEIDFGPGKQLPAVAIGDSVMVGAKVQLRDRFGPIRIDARVARQVKDGIQRLELMRHRRLLGSVVIIHLGNNGHFTTPQFERMMDVLAGIRRVIFVNVKVPRRWETSVNRVLLAGYRRHPDIVIVNWHRLWRTCRGRVFGADATHLTPAGARCYSKMLQTASIIK
jgi:peptidoglycan/LPS O-acetylase OafA/YrhL